MKTPSGIEPRRASHRNALAMAVNATVLLGVPCLGSTPVFGMDLSPPDSDFTFRLDTTVSYGRIWRVQGQAHHNDAFNQNDGNRNFNTGLASEVYKLTSDVDLKYKNYGAFVRGTAFYDTQIMDKRNDYEDNNTPAQPSQNYPKNSSFTKAARDKAGSDAQILDAYVYGNWDVGGHAVSSRLGRQVFNWGEGLFYRGGINTTNPVDVAKLRLPGAEVKEVLVPLEALSFTVNLTENLSTEAFYQWNWKESSYDPAGTLFSESDLFVPGSHTAYANNASLANPAFLNTYRQLSALGVGGLQGTEYLDSNGNFKVASVGRDINAKDDGQFGVSFRYLAEALNATEFGFYFVNYHAKDPTIASSINSTHLSLDSLASLATRGAVSSYPSLVSAATTSPVAAQALGLINGASVVELGNLTTARREFPENIRMFGLSFNTSVADASVFGELSYRPNLPIGRAALNDTVFDAFSQSTQILQGQTVN